MCPKAGSTCWLATGHINRCYQKLLASFARDTLQHMHLGITTAYCKQDILDILSGFHTEAFTNGASTVGNLAQALLCTLPGHGQHDFMATFGDGQHWRVIAISPLHKRVYLLDPLAGAWPRDVKMAACKFIENWRSSPDGWRLHGHTSSYSMMTTIAGYGLCGYNMNG